MGNSNGGISENKSRHSRLSAGSMTDWKSGASGHGSQRSAGSDGSNKSGNSSRKKNNKSRSFSFVYNGKRVVVNEQDLVGYLFPIYYTKEEFTKDDCDRCEGSWKMIMNNESPRYKDIIADPEKSEAFKLQFTCCKDWFASEFYARFFDVHPYAKMMFKDAKSQGNFLVAFFSFIFTAFENPPVYQAKLNYLGEIHSLRGVKATEYGLVGEVMFWTLGKVLGQAYSAEVHYSWVRLFSSVIKVIIPIAVHHELQDNSAQKNRFEKQFENDFGEDYAESRSHSNLNAPTAFDVATTGKKDGVSNHISAHSSNHASAHGSASGSTHAQGGAKTAVEELNAGH